MDTLISLINLSLVDLVTHFKIQISLNSIFILHFFFLESTNERKLKKKKIKDVNEILVVLSTLESNPMNEQSEKQKTDS